MVKNLAIFCWWFRQKQVQISAIVMQATVELIAMGTGEILIEIMGLMWFHQEQWWFTGIYDD